jgi:hypothetical protein
MHDRYCTFARTNWLFVPGLIVFVIESVPPLTVLVWMAVQFCKLLDVCTITVSPVKSPEMLVTILLLVTEEPSVGAVSTLKFTITFR